MKNNSKFMSNDCLLLNGNGKPLSYFPLSTIDWKTSIKLVLTKNVIIIKNHDDWVVRSPSVTVDVPSIIMLRRFHKFQNYVKFSRSNVYLRDMYKCQYCSDIFERKSPCRSLTILNSELATYLPTSLSNKEKTSRQENGP